MQPTIAIVEDEADLRDAIAEYLADRGLHVVQADSAEALRAILASQPIDLAVLDIAMPGEDGLALARWLRARDARPGIIFATAAGTTLDRVVGLELGADDYLTKPYEPRELLARVRSVLRRLPALTTVRRSVPAPAEPEPLVPVGDFLLDLGRHRLTTREGAPIELTMMEQTLLEVLVARPNRLLSRSQLLELTGFRGDAGGRAIDVRVTRLRRKIEADPDRPMLIRTARGEGYTYVPDTRG